MKSVNIIGEIRYSIRGNLYELIDLGLKYPGLKVRVYIDDGMKSLMVCVGDDIMELINPDLPSLMAIEKIVEKVKEGIENGTWNPGAEKSVRSSSGTTPVEQNAG